MVLALNTGTAKTASFAAELASHFFRIGRRRIRDLFGNGRIRPSLLRSVQEGDQKLWYISLSRESWVK